MNLLDPTVSPQSALPLIKGLDNEAPTSVCSLTTGNGLFGIDTRKIREVLGHNALEPVPLAPDFIGGILPYRGEVLTVVSFRALLGLKPAETPGCILVLKSADEEELYGLMVDRVGGVAMLSRQAFSENPTTLDEVGRALYSGVFRMDKGLLILLDPDRLQPSRLAATALFRCDANLPNPIRHSAQTS